MKNKYEYLGVSYSKASPVALAILDNELSTGPKPLGDLKRIANECGINIDSLAKAKKEIKAKSCRVGSNSWYWYLPGKGEELLLEQSKSNREAEERRIEKRRIKRMAAQVEREKEAEILARQIVETILEG